MFEGLRKAFSSLTERVKTTTISAKDLDESLSRLEAQLVSNDVALTVAESIVKSLRADLEKVRVSRLGGPSEAIQSAIRRTLQEIVLEADPREILNRVEENIKQKKSTVVLFVGPNGSGKTTTVVKVAAYLRKQGYSSVISCSDTFRAGAIEQLKELAEREGIWVVSQQYGADPAAVAVDAIRRAEAAGIPVVLIDTAGRTEVDSGLLEEMRKIKSVTKPDFVIYVGDALTGNAAAEQARQFDRYVGLEYVVLAKLDADARGGSSVSISQVTGKPLLFVGVGQKTDDLEPFPKKRILEALSIS